MGIPVVVVSSGGLPVTESASGLATPMEIASNGFGIPVTVVNSGGLPVAGVGVGPEAVTSGTLISDFENAALWTAGGTGASKAANTVEKQAGAQSVKLTGSGSSNVHINFDTSFVLNAGDVVTLWYNVDVPTDVTSITVYLSETSGFAKYGYFQGFPSSTDIPGKHVLSFATSDMSDDGTGLTFPITIQRVRIQRGASVASEVSFDSLYINRKLTKPRIILGFDDGLDDHYDFAFPYMAGKNMKGTAYIVSDFIGGAGSMTLSELQALYAAGWDIANHTKTHPHANGMSQGDLETELSTCTTYLTSNGMPRAALHYAAPFGEIPANLTAAMTALGFKTGRHVTGNPIQTALGLYSPYGLPSLVPTSGTTLNQMKAYLDLAIARGCSAHFCFHDFPVTATTGNEVSQANFQAFIDYVATKRDAGLIDVVTISEWFNGVTQAA